MLVNMDGKFKIIVILIVAIVCSCKKQVTVENSGRELITQNINVLIDSIEMFDMRLFFVPEKYKNVKTEKISIGLLDSIVVENLSNIKETNFIKFNISEKEIHNYKSNYKIAIVKLNNFDTKVLFVRFSNFEINENNASIVVKKVIGISMIKERYYFIKQNDMWVFKKKEFLGMG